MPPRKSTAATDSENRQPNNAAAAAAPAVSGKPASDFMDSPKTTIGSAAAGKKKTSTMSAPLAPRPPPMVATETYDDFDYAAVEQQLKKARQQSRMSSDRRRSSFSLRGKRKSSFGELQAAIHADIPADQFYRHISPELPDPVRLRQMLLYSMQREMDMAKKSEEDPVEVAAQSVLADMFQRLITKKINTSWYHRERENLPLVTQPNPENAKNQQLVDAYAATLTRLKKEEEQWDQLLLEHELVAAKLAEEKRVAAERSAESTASVDVSRIVADMELRQLMALDEGGHRTLAEKDLAEMKRSVERLSVDLSTTATDLHQLQSYVRATNAHVQNRFTTLIDVCWPRKAGAAQEADAESVEAVRRRLMAKRKAFYADWQQDKTMDLLRVLAAASAPAEAFMMSPMGPGSALATPRARSMMAESPLAKSSTVASSIAASTLAKSSSATPSSSSAVASPTPASPFPMDLDE